MLVAGDLAQLKKHFPVSCITLCFSDFFINQFLIDVFNVKLTCLQKLESKIKQIILFVRQIKWNIILFCFLFPFFNRCCFSRTDEEIIWKANFQKFPTFVSLKWGLLFRFCLQRKKILIYSCFQKKNKNKIKAYSFIFYFLFFSNVFFLTNLNGFKGCLKLTVTLFLDC